MEFRWVAAIALWTMLSGPVLVSVTAGPKNHPGMADHHYNMRQEKQHPVSQPAPKWQPPVYQWPEQPAGLPAVSFE
jgi:hypothetical protein